MYRNGYRALGDIVVPHEEGVVANTDPDQMSAYDMQQDQFSDIVVPHSEDVVVNADANEGLDLQQTEFADDIEVRSIDLPVGHAPQTQLVRVSPLPVRGFGDMPYSSPSEIRGGDDGLGFGAARRLRARIKGKRMKLGGPRVMYVNSSWRYGTGDTLYDPYGFGFRLRFPRIRLRLPKFIRKFQFGRFLGRTALPLAAGGAAGLLVARKGIPALANVFRGGGGAQPAAEPTAPPEIAAPSPAPSVPGVVMPTAPTPSVPSAPVATDTAGGALPPDILAALRGSISPVGGREAPTSSEEVASAAEQAGGGQETGGVTEAGLGLGLGETTMGPVLLIGLGLAIAASLATGGKRGRRRR